MIRWIFIIVILLLLELYAFQAFKVVFRESNWKWVFLGISLAVSLNLLLQFIMDPDRSVAGGFKAFSIGIFMCFFVLKAVLILIMFGEDLYRVAVGIYNKFTGNSSSTEGFLPSRRKFVSMIGIGVAAIPFAGMLYGMFQGKYDFRVLSYELEFDDLPDAFDGYQITHISDIHVGSFENRGKVAYAIDLLNKQESDVIFFTGDLVNNRADELEGWEDLFSTISAPDGVFSVLGNHDYGDYIDWESKSIQSDNLDYLKKIQKDMGWKLLLNENGFLEKDGQKIAVVGVENWGNGRFVKYGDLDKATQGLNKEDFKIVLSHDPSHWQAQIKNNPMNYQLTLSGHTHGMQFGVEIPGIIKWSPAKYVYENWAGIYKEFDSIINVNRGFGFLGYPGRAGIWPEITVIKLKKSSN